MPLVCMTANQMRLSESTLLQLGRELQQWVAEVLTCGDPDGQLRPEDVEVSIRGRSPRFDIGGEKYDIAVTVLANDFPSRRKNLKERCQQLREKLKACLLLRECHGFVWIRLAPAAFEEF